MAFEYGLVVGREEVLRPPPRAFALDHRVDGDVADPELSHSCLPELSAERSGGRLSVQVKGAQDSSNKLRLMLHPMRAIRTHGLGPAKQRQSTFATTF